MRVYEKGDKVRGPDDAVYTVVEAMVAPHPTTPGKVKAVYKVTDAGGAERVLRDQDVRNLPKP